MHNPDVSVIMPGYNAGLYVADSIESVIHQTHTNWELLIVDDGSTDDTKTIVDCFCRKDLRIKYFYQQNGKQGKARNLAFSHANGEFIAFLDADDIWMPEKLEIQLQQLEEKKADLVFSESNSFSEKILDNLTPVNSGKGFFEGEAGLKSFLDLNKIPMSTVLVKAEAIKKAKGFTEKLCIQNAEDYHLWLKLLMNENIFFGSDKVLSNYRKHPASASYADRISVVKTLEVLKDLKNTYKPYKKILNAYHKKWFNRCHYSTNNWDKKIYRQLIKKNCNYINASFFNIFFQITYSVFGLNIARNLICRIVNQNKF